MGYAYEVQKLRKQERESRERASRQLNTRALQIFQCLLAFSRKLYFLYIPHYSLQVFIYNSQHSMNSICTLHSLHSPLTLHSLIYFERKKIQLIELYAYIYGLEIAFSSSQILHSNALHTWPEKLIKEKI